ncbi:acetyl-CoA carboxylase carboxyl transferase subunit beta [Caloranaerobacter azorensis DSM 13643]|uniref:Acetyl-coenzyme A carboxylase carboxyl transferase subunit beta n=1 Tax=Caloranaerobacter azorensis DSM 13643 TaxID=1121264 RepID=A0A1M5RHV7_9FIRM|nr:acetyl-CoA carboxylase, carboxyltransferase subunit beta [Caloranaerobacter azorensis]SHH25758.1 acetyl-CoA carboxylase carboxyl transferase subunit beta [Caloranaerobacter azorensis DSM 13643]
MIKDLFHKRKYATITLYKEEKEVKKLIDERPKMVKEKTVIDDDKHIKCKKCGEVLSIDAVKKNLMVCTKCDYHFRIGSTERINIIFDSGSFNEYDKELKPANPLNFPEYEKKIEDYRAKTGLEEAVVTGEGKIKGHECIACIMEPNFMMGSMGSVVGEKITRAIERAIEKKMPLIIFSASGGARMQEGILSLMQMAKTSAALGRLSEEGLLYISVFTDPTTGGVTASFAMLGDIIISEPGALIGFAGPRVIEQTIRQKLPEGFQRAEFLKDKGFVDKIVHRKNLRDVLADILYIHSLRGEADV